MSLIILVEPQKPLDDYAHQMIEAGVPTKQMIMGRDLDLGVVQQLADEFRERQCDAVHTHLIHADLHGVLAAKRAGIQHIFFTGHNDDGFRRRWPVRLLQSYLWRQVEAGITISEALHQFVIDVEFAPSTRVHTVHYGLDATTIAPVSDAKKLLCQSLGLTAETPLVGSVCRLTAQKGITYAIQALRTLPDVHYVIAGDGPLRASLEAEARSYQMQDRVHFLGWRDDVQLLMSAFDVLLMPSLWEGFGLVSLEAMAVRKPIIASRVTALPEIVVDGETGYLVPPADSATLAARLSDIINDPAKAEIMGDNGRKRLEAVFSVQRMVEGTLKVYGLA